MLFMLASTINVRHEICPMMSSTGPLTAVTFREELDTAGAKLETAFVAGECTSDDSVTSQVLDLEQLVFAGTGG